MIIKNCERENEDKALSFEPLVPNDETTEAVQATLDNPDLPDEFIRDILAAKKQGEFEPFEPSRPFAACAPL